MANSKGVVRFHVLHPFSFTGKKRIKELISVLVAEEGKIFSTLDYIFCSDEYLLEINKKYLGHDDLTDIVTFDLSDGNDPIIGEIYISVERVRDNSHLFSVPFSEELYRVIVHGILHLCGYNDKSPNDQKRMRAKEDYYLSKLQ